MDISLLLSSVSGAVDLGRLLVNERDRQKAAVIQTDLTEKLIQAQAQVSQVLAAIIEKDSSIKTLSDRVRELETQQSERARYELAKASTVGDFFAYRLRPASELAERADEPSHLLCQPCFDAGKKSVLSVHNSFANCSLCKRSARVSETPPSNLPRRSGYQPF